MTNKPPIAILSDQPNTLLNNLATRLAIPILQQKTDAYPYYLTIFQHHLAIIENRQHSRPIYIDFTADKNIARGHSGWRQELIARACGIKAGFRSNIIDATAGFGEDAFVLASLGCTVTMLERSAILAALLENALMNLRPTADKKIQLQLIHTDSIHYLTQLTTKPDVIYLDPMFPERKQSALVKKNMRLLRDLVGTDPDYTQLFNVALTKAGKRVVVKRAKLAPTITPQPADICYIGRRIRFDVYLTC